MAASWSVSRSDRPRELGECGHKALVRAGLDAELVVASPQVLHERVTGHVRAGAAIGLESAHRPQLSFEPAVVGLDPIIRVPLGVMKRAG
jgi:hypothetical protein